MAGDGRHGRTPDPETAAGLETFCLQGRDQVMGRMTGPGDGTHERQMLLNDERFSHLLSPSGF